MKFRRGDKVRCIKDSTGQFRVGQTYTVRFSPWVGSDANIYVQLEGVEMAGYVNNFSNDDIEIEQFILQEINERSPIFGNDLYYQVATYINQNCQNNFPDINILNIIDNLVKNKLVVRISYKKPGHSNKNTIYFPNNTSIIIDK
jgi:hypothetical protein